MAQFGNINVKKIVLEEINQYFKTQMLSEGLFEDEDEGSENQSSNQDNLTDWQKKRKKDKEEYDKREGGEADSNNAKSAIKFLSHDCINASKVLERATGLDPTSASSEASKYISGEWPITKNLVETINQIKAELTS